MRTVTRFRRYLMIGATTGALTLAGGIAVSADAGIASPLPKLAVFPVRDEIARDPGDAALDNDSVPAADTAPAADTIPPEDGSQGG